MRSYPQHLSFRIPRFRQERVEHGLIGLGVDRGAEQLRCSRQSHRGQFGLRILEDFLAVGFSGSVGLPDDLGCVGVGLVNDLVILYLRAVLRIGHDLERFLLRILQGGFILLLERLRGVPVEAPTRTPARWEQLQEQIVEALLAWHRQDSGGCVGMVDNTQENLWPNWYRQRVEILWSTLNLYQDTGLTMQDKRLLFRSRECLPELFRDFNDNAVLVHGNFTLRSMLKDPRSDQLLAMVGPGMMLWAPREYELFRLAEGGQAEQLLWRYLQQAPVSEAFVWRRWLYLLWDEVDSLVNTGRFDRARFDLAAKSLLPWLA